MCAAGTLTKIEFGKKLLCLLRAIFTGVLKSLGGAFRDNIVIMLSRAAPFLRGITGGMPAGGKDRRDASYGPTARKFHRCLQHGPSEGPARGSTQTVGKGQLCSRQGYVLMIDQRLADTRAA